MAMQYHVTYVPEGLKFLVIVDDKKDVVSQIRTKVNAQSTDTLHIQLYDKDWDDYINVLDSEIESKCPNRAKLKVYLTSTSHKNSTNTPCNTDSVLHEMEQPPLPKNRSTCTITSSATIASQLLESQDVPPLDGMQPLQSSNDSNQSEELVIEHVDCDAEPMTSAADKRSWPSTYPDYAVRADVMEKLKKGSDLSVHESGVLLESWYIDMIKVGNTVYPTSWQYHKMTELLIDRFPIVQSQSSHADAMDHWNLKLQRKFQNLRKHRGNDRADVATRKKKTKPTEKPDTGEAMKLTSPTALRKGIVLHSHEGEDSHSLASHVTILQDNFRKKSPPMEEVSASMLITFPNRRALILKATPVEIILKEYPWLRRYSQFRKEYLRLEPVCPDVPGSLVKGLKMYGGKLIALVKEKKLASDCLVYKSCQLQLKAAADSIERNYIHSCMAMLALLLLMKEDPTQLFVCSKHGEPSISLALRYKGNMWESSCFTVVVEGNDVVTSENAVDGLAMMLMAAFIFNIHYPLCAKGYFKFLEKYFLGTQITVSKTVKSLMDKLRISQ